MCKIAQNGRRSSTLFPSIPLIFDGISCKILQTNPRPIPEESLMSQAPMSADATSDDKLWALLAYILTPIVPIILLLLQDKKDRPFIKAHNAQALAWGVVFYVIVTITSFFLIGLCIWPLGLILQIYW